MFDLPKLFYSDDIYFWDLVGIILKIDSHAGGIWGGVMASCEYSASCSFLTKEVVNMPKTSDYLRNKYCDGDFYACVLFNSKSVGFDNVPDKLHSGLNLMMD